MGINERGAQTGRPQDARKRGKRIHFGQQYTRYVVGLERESPQIPIKALKRAVGGDVVLGRPFEGILGGDSD